MNKIDIAALTQELKNYVEKKNISHFFDQDYNLEEMRALNEPEINLYLGLIYRLAGEAGESISLLLDFLKQYPTHIEALRQVFFLLNAGGRYAEVLDLFDKLDEKVKVDPVTVRHALTALIASGQYFRVEDFVSFIREKRITDLNSIQFILLIFLLGSPSLSMEVVKATSSHDQGGSVDPAKIYVLQHIFKDVPLAELWSNLSEFFDDFEGKRNWLLLQLGRTHIYDPSSIALLKQDTLYPIEQAAFVYSPIPSMNSVLHHDIPLMEAVQIDVPRFGQGLEGYFDLVRQMNDKGEFDTAKQNVLAVKDKYAPNAHAPISILSSGRAGTTSLHHLFQKLEDTFSFHSYQWQMPTTDRNHVLYRILENNFVGEPIRNVIKSYVSIRTTELIYAYRLGKTPVFTGHWDSILMPIWSVLFPESKFIYLERDNVATFKSIYEKNQWFDNQLQALRYDKRFPNDCFHHCLDTRLNITQKISWFLFTTQLFGRKVADFLPENKYLHLKSEDLFNTQKDAYADLSNFLEIAEITSDYLTEHFSTPINEKSQKVVFRKDSKQQTKYLEQYFDQLAETGSLIR
ncbi:tetratricopeptide repeat protein [Curvivirga sp.]|uniref:tetratricopeptide repeat protein n=1 Tax=Curvivirga sp. TaxID=2856848 RepID=UPI003B5B8F8B